MVMTLMTTHYNVGNNIFFNNDINEVGNGFDITAFVMNSNFGLLERFILC